MPSRTSDPLPIDFLLLLAIASDGVSIVVICLFYTDPAYPIEPEYLSLVLLATFMAFCLRKWHFRKTRMTHQSWLPYLGSGCVSWVGLL